MNSINWLQHKLEVLLARWGYYRQSVSAKELTFSDQEMEEAWENIQLRLATRKLLKNTKNDSFFYCRLSALGTKELYHFGSN